MSEERVGVAGWKQFLGARRRMLAAFDISREQARGHEVETYHGLVAQARFRQWLTDFLPKRYGVCSGFIISHSRPGDEPLPHFDVIIYDALNSPVLWIEDHPDVSTGGASRAIPAEHVLAVFEVKASLNPTTAKKAIEHLHDLDPLLEEDVPGAQQPKFLPARFFCFAVFFELRKEYERSTAALDALALTPNALRGYAGALVLRAEGDEDLGTGRIQPIAGDAPLESGVESLLVTIGTISSPSWRAPATTR